LLHPGYVIKQIQGLVYSQLTKCMYSMSSGIHKSHTKNAPFKILFYVYCISKKRKILYIQG